MISTIKNLNNNNNNNNNDNSKNNNNDNNNNNNSNESKNSNSSLILKPTPDLALLFNPLINSTIPSLRKTVIQKLCSKYYDIDELQQVKIPNKEKFDFRSY